MCVCVCSRAHGRGVGDRQFANLKFCSKRAYLLICLLATGRLVRSSLKRYCLVPMQKSWMYWSQSRMRMSKSNSCLSSSDMTERSLSWLVWDHCGQKSRGGREEGRKEGKRGRVGEGREGG